ncbi:hypothetical protein AVEN_79536-1 [Araneus ventricosus]|uniref:Uncharacterized protein n=1 Tax=Araneus ventricosus TaxID=182803 RepID=A0A4Y2NAT1_ARAVE|nr:hypothetical protein AVEN_79536-1 [Araneus ventricosus]
MGKNGDKPSQDRERGDEEDSDDEPVLDKSDIPNELKKFIDGLDPDDFLEDIEEDLRDNLKAFNKLSNTTIQSKLQYGKKLRNKIALTFVTDMVDIIIRLCAPSFRSSPLEEPEGVLLIKPKADTLKDFIVNRKIFTDILEKFDPSVRLRNIGKFYGGGVRMVAASHGDIMIVKGLFKEYGDKETMNGFDFIIPNRRSPQLIIYNVDKEVDQEQLKAGLLAKNISLADSSNKPHF